MQIKEAFAENPSGRSNIQRRIVDGGAKGTSETKRRGTTSESVAVAQIVAALDHPVVAASIRAARLHRAHSAVDPDPCLTHLQRNWHVHTNRRRALHRSLRDLCHRVEHGQHGRALVTIR